MEASLLNGRPGPAECPVCLDTLDQPKALNCHHVFCKMCIYQVADGGRILCPLCRQEQRFHPGFGIEDLAAPLRAICVRPTAPSAAPWGPPNAAPWRPPSASPVQVTALRNVCTEVGVDAVLYDLQSQMVYVRTWDYNSPLWRYELSGAFRGKVLTPSVNDWGCGLCMDTTRDVIVVSQGDKILCLDRAGRLLRDTAVPGAAGLQGVAFCPETDVYVVSDTGHHCLWFVDAARGQVIRQVSGGRSGPFYYPYYVCHASVGPGECKIIVSDCYNHCVKMLSPSGEYLTTFGYSASGASLLSYPRGVCMDPQGRVVVCDSRNMRVVRFWLRAGVPCMDILLTPKDLGWMEPDGIVLTAQRHLVVTQRNDQHIRGFTYSDLRGAETVA